MKGVNPLRRTSKKVVGWTGSVLTIAAAAAVALLADSAMAQAPGRVPGEDAGYLQWIVFGGIAFVVCATGFLNPKRSHLN
jgi:hypothetical protein